MAIIRGAFGGAQIKGSISSVTFARGRYGTVARSRVTPVNPNTELQGLARNAMSYCNNYWLAQLSAAERTAWNEYASNTPLVNQFGDNYYVSGREMFIRYNAIIKFTGGTTLLATAPATPGLASSIQFVGSIEAATDLLVITDFIDELETGETAAISISPAQTQQRVYWRGPWNRTYLVATNPAPSVSLFLPAPAVLGQRYIVRIYRRSADGRVGARLNQIIDVSPAP